MTHDIIDNRNEYLIDHIRQILPGSQAAHFAVGYFFLSGLESVADVLDGVSELRLLIGSTSSRETIEQMAEGYRRLEQLQSAVDATVYRKRADMARDVERTAADVGRSAALLDQTDASERLVGTLVRLIEEGRLHVRVHTRGRLHAKAYIFDYGPVYDAGGHPLPRPERGIAVVGSSNFTLSGVATNTELNVLVHGNANHAALKGWFDALWDQAQDFEAHLMRELRASWALAPVTPYEIYLKALYELVHDRLDGAERAEFLWRGDITAVLTEFQERAVRQAVRMIRRYNGCFIADVVGLGKSYIGAAVVKHFERVERARPLIICPATLVGMWEHYNEAYQLNARVLSTGLLREGEDNDVEWMQRDERFRHRDFVLVDESHNFRNTTSQRYRVLQSFLATGDRRCVFLTATPRNKSVWDIYHQIQLFHPTDVTDLPVDPPNLREFFKRVEQGERRLPELLSHLLIRRTRMHVLRWYGYDAETDRRVDPDDFAPYREGVRRAYVRVGGKRQFFPQRRLRTVEYSIEATYGGLYERLRRCLGRPLAADERPAPGELTYARYGLWNYVLPAAQDRPPYADLHRAGANLRGLMRVMLFKRFESSVHAFRETVALLLRMHTAFLDALEQGIVPAGEEARRLLYESDQDEEQDLFDALQAVSGRYRAADFDLDRLRSDITQDVTVLGEMLEMVEPITPNRDAKLQTLRAWLARPPLQGNKVLIFTQYAHTAQYLVDSLVASSSGPDGGGQPDPVIEVIYSREKSKAEIVGRFAPRANPEQRLPAGAREIQTLIATDVLSEGLNLQDCARVVNYDLHWNPVRLIQRFGRVDRIGSEHDEVFAFNFLPETELERNLGLTQTLAHRIEEIHETIGEDAAILDPTERLNQEAMYTIYAEGDLGQYEEDDADAFIDLHEAEEILRQLRADRPELYERIENLRDGVRSARSAHPLGAVVLCRAGDYRQLVLVDGAGEVVSRDAPRILGLLRCEPDTPAATVPPGHNQAVTVVKAAFDSEVAARRAERAHTQALSPAQRYVRMELKALYGATQDADVRAHVAELESAFTRPGLRPAAATELNRIRRQNLAGSALLDSLTDAFHRFALDAVPVTAADAGPEDDELPRVVCSEALT